MSLVITGSLARREDYLWAVRAISTILVTISIIIFVVHTVRCFNFVTSASLKKTKVYNKTQKWRKLSHIFTLWTLLSFVIMSGNYTINAWSLYPGSGCNAVEIFSVYSYHMSKFFLYITLILRIKVAFCESTYYDAIKKAVKVLYVLLFIYFVIITVCDNIVISGTETCVVKDMCYCLLDPLPAWGVLLFTLMDLTISISCCVAFIYPLRRLMKVTSQQSSATYIEVIRKYAILTVTAVVSTFVLVFVNSALQMGWMILLDNVVNAICILLMSHFYVKLYNLLCCCCSKTVAKLDRVMSIRSLDNSHNTSHNKDQSSILGTHTPHHTTTTSVSPRESNENKKRVGSYGDISLQPPPLSDRNDTMKFKDAPIRPPTPLGSDNEFQIKFEDDDANDNEPSISEEEP